MDFIIIIGVIVLAFILYNLFFSSGAKQKSENNIIAAAVNLGVPGSEAKILLETEMEKLTPLLIQSSMGGSKIKNLNADERMGYCISILYKKNHS